MKHNGGMKFGAMGIALMAVMGAQPVLAGQVKASVDTTVRLGYDINPFLSEGRDLGSGVAQVDVRPALSYRTETGETVLSGHYDHSQYQRLYGHSDEYGATLDTRKRLSPSLNVFATLRYDSSVIGQGDSLAGNVAGTPPVDNTDVNLIGQRQRSNIYSAQAGGTYKLGPKDDISVDGGVTLTHFPNRPAGSNSNDYGGRIAYTHAVSDRTKIGFSESVYKIVYDIASLNTLVAEPALTFSTQFSPTWTFDASLGVSISSIEQPGVSGRERSISWAGSTNLCHKGSKNNFCFYASRSVSSSGFGGTTENDQAGLQFRQTLTEHLSAHANASYARTKSQIASLGIRQYVSADLGLDQRITRRLRIGVDGRYRDVFGSGPSIKSDIGGEVNATLSLPGPS